MGFCQGSSVGAELRDFSAAFLQHNSMDSKSRKVVGIFVFKLLCFYANRWILLDRSVSMSKRLKYFNAVVSFVACFGSGHRAIYNSQLATLDVHFEN